MTLDYNELKKEFYKKDKEFKRAEMKARVREILREREAKARALRANQ